MLFANREYCKDFLLAFCLLYIRPKHLGGRDTQSHVSGNRDRRSKIRVSHRLTLSYFWLSAAKHSVPTCLKLLFGAMLTLVGFVTLLQVAPARALAMGEVNNDYQ
ncbi:MAG: hypothetical protein DRH08_14600 [Deltaproteobacteria bacterium]|nr:MAG: hypothetical protein DRH08_14600 [Deltaproteobacteria bacterium]